MNSGRQCPAVTALHQAHQGSTTAPGAAAMPAQRAGRDVTAPSTVCSRLPRGHGWSV